MGGDNSWLSELASRQHGAFNLEQARSAGFDKHAVGRRVAAGHWRQIDHRVYSLPASPPTWERQLWVALLSRPRAVVAGRSAAYLHAVRGFKHGKPVIAVPGSSNARSAIARVIRAEHFETLETCSVEGFPATSLAETMVQLGTELHRSHFEDLIDELILASRLVAEDCLALIERDSERRRKGIVMMREVVSARLGTAPSVGSSYLEAILEGVLDVPHIPSWSREHPFTVVGSAARVDVLIAEWGLVIEADGRNWHARMSAFESDRARDNDLATQGIQVLRFTYAMLRDAPDQCLDTIVRAGRVRRATGSGFRYPLL